MATYEQLFPKETTIELANRMVRRILQSKSVEGFSNTQIRRILKRTMRLLSPLPAMIEIEAPLTIFGDLHGQLNDLIRYFQAVGFPSDRKMLFLGDYVDRGGNSFEVIMLLFCYLVMYPKNVYMLRGNHECLKMNRLYGFHSELKRKRNLTMWVKFQKVFNQLPLCATISRKILCMHGGISEHITSWKSLYDLKKPNRPKLCDEGIAMDLMWADPTQDKCSTFASNTMRSISVLFGEKAISDLLDMLNLELVVRAHEVSQEGYHFFFNKKLVTVFSAPFYCGNDVNCGAIMHVSNKLEVSFTVLRPLMVPTPENFHLAVAMEQNYKDLRAPSPDPNRGRHLTPAPADSEEAHPNKETEKPKQSIS
ncbi:unnamed protein product [Caenorhabditis bovis]|uniref:Serine/threonine-protein phosphatase n=1 Tax=Caenorhabditis bovis TaxID=2654633 RepID=A0A8S1F9Q0_9PELO|nr:unnamed protein product [Caenorhabditis bovis]